MSLSILRWWVVALLLTLGLTVGCSGETATPRVLPDVAAVRDVQGIATPSYAGGNGFPVPDEVVPAAEARRSETRVTPWPTFTPVATIEPIFAVKATPTGNDAEPATVPVFNQPAKRFTCLADYRRWLVNYEWSSARDLHRGMRDFRELRPDCNNVVFAPEFSSSPYCRDEDRVGGARVGSFFSMGQAHNYNLQLLGTRRSGSGDMLIHFARLPKSNRPGCWYYEARLDRWFETEIGGNDSEQAMPTAVPVQGGFKFCDDALRRRFYNDPGLVDAAMLQAVAGEVATGLVECSFGWNPKVSDVRVADYCPARESGWAADGSIVVHWSEKTWDGVSCWFYDPASGQGWESR